MVFRAKNDIFWGLILQMGLNKSMNEWKVLLGTLCSGKLKSSAFPTNHFTFSSKSNKTLDILHFVTNAPTLDYTQFLKLQCKSINNALSLLEIG